jgi:hypothetical protein
MTDAGTVWAGAEMSGIFELGSIGGLGSSNRLLEQSDGEGRNSDISDGNTISDEDIVNGVGIDMTRGRFE